MAWNTIASPQQKKATQVSFALLLWGRQKTAKFCFSLPTAIAAQHGLEKSDRANVHLGTGEHDGKIWVQPSATGAFAVAKLAYVVSVKFPVTSGVPLVAQSASLPFEAHPDGGVIFDMPDWAKPQVINGEVKASDDKPGGLEINGNTIILDSKEVVLFSTHAQAFKCLHNAFGTVVPTSDIVDFIKSHDDKIIVNESHVEAWMKKIQVSLDTQRFPLRITAHRGKGYSLQRAVA